MLSVKTDIFKPILLEVFLNILNLTTISFNWGHPGETVSWKQLLLLILLDPRFLCSLLFVIISPQTYYLFIVNILNVPGMNNIESENPALSSLQGNNCRFCCVFIHLLFRTCIKHLRMKYLIPKTCTIHVSYEAELTFMNPFSSLRNDISVTKQPPVCFYPRCSPVTLHVFDLHRNDFLPIVFYFFSTNCILRVICVAVWGCS